MTDGDVTVKSHKCAECGVRRPVTSVVEDGLDSIRCECWGLCDDYTHHEHTGNEWEALKVEYQCTKCDYETLVWRIPSDPDEFPDCPECPSEGSDRPEDYDRSLAELTTVSGVGEGKADHFIDAGYRSIADLRRASQSELASLSAIGNALAARIKADVGSEQGEAPVGRLRLKRATLEADRVRFVNAK